MARSPEALATAVSEQGVPERYATPPTANHDLLAEALNDAVERIDANLEDFYDRFPEPSSDDLVYGSTDNAGGWTTSFWTGLCWLAYEVTGAGRFRDAAETQIETFERRLESGDTNTHDLGFLYTLSAVAGHRITGNDRYRSAALTAADLLAERFLEAPGLIQAWGDVGGDDWTAGRTIVDTMMNLPLLFWASETTGDPSYAAIAETHARTAADHLVREDGSTFHTFKCDPETGEPLGGETAQGYEDDSCWARGQAWAIYGYALVSDYRSRAPYAELSAKLGNYYLHELPDDDVPRWDFDAPEPDIRDTSAAAIAACGFDELARGLPSADERVPAYRNASLATLESLAEHYTAGADSNGLLSDAAYHRKEDDYDECCIWGDYFYVEGLVRATEHADWGRYW